MSQIDIEKLREDLEDYFGTAMFSGNPQAMMELEKVRKASKEELISLARRHGVNINDYTERENEEYYR